MTAEIYEAVCLCEPLTCDLPGVIAAWSRRPVECMGDLRAANLTVEESPNRVLLGRPRGAR